MIAPGAWPLSTTLVSFIRRDVQEAPVNDTRCCALVGNINNTHKHTTGQGVRILATCGFDVSG
jgi:hypothetical protein